MREYRPFLIYPVASLFAIVAVTLLVGCGESAKLPETAGIGPTPQLPAPSHTGALVSRPPAQLAVPHVVVMPG